jgi:hypothetical protein
METIKRKYHCFSTLICVLMVSALSHTLVHAAQTRPGVQRLEEGITAYGHGEYDDAIFKLEMAKIQISEGDKERLWKVHFYLGLSYCLTGENDEARKQFIKTQELIKNRLPDSHMYSPKIVKMFNNTIVLTRPGASGTFRDSITGMEFVFVKGGCYEMGDYNGLGFSDH